MTAITKQSHPLRYAANLAVRKALYHRTLVRPEACEQCPATRHLNAHHDDYTKPLSVRWLCGKCHVAHHKTLQPFQAAKRRRAAA